MVPVVSQQETFDTKLDEEEGDDQQLDPKGGLPKVLVEPLDERETVQMCGFDEDQEDVEGSQ